MKHSTCGVHWQSSWTVFELIKLYHTFSCSTPKLNRPNSRCWLKRVNDVPRWFLVLYCRLGTQNLNSSGKCIVCKIPLSTSIQWNSIYRIVSGRFVWKLFVHLRLLFVGDDVIYCSMLTTHIWQSMFEKCATQYRRGQVNDPWPNGLKLMGECAEATEINAMQTKWWKCVTELPFIQWNEFEYNSMWNEQNEWPAYASNRFLFLFYLLLLTAIKWRFCTYLVRVCVHFHTSWLI